MRDSEVIALLHSQRHSFLNHLQVVAGWIQLGQSDRASAYIDKIAAGIASQGEVLSKVPDEVGIALVAVFLHAEAHAVEVSVRVAVPPSPLAAFKLQEFLMAAVRAAQPLPEGRRHLEVVLAGNRLSVSFQRAVVMPFSGLIAAAHETSLP